MMQALGAELATLARSLSRITVQLEAAHMGQGCGVVWRPDGIIVTNAHVARGAQARVRLWNGRTLEGRIVARQRDSDLAAILVPDAQLEAAVPGDAAALRPGELVVALGHPLGIVNSIALGVIHQIVHADHGKPSWIRADIRLAPGNSGGPLADTAGRVLGINTLIAGGLGYAIPAPEIEHFLGEAGLATPGERAA